MKILFFFIDGIGLGVNDSTINPFATKSLHTIESLLSGRKIIKGSAPYHGERVSLLALDACLNVQGVPQSATGQAALLTGKNVPELVGYHFGPWPNKIVINTLNENNIFSVLRKNGLRSTLLNAYPPSYFNSINSGKRLYSVIPQSVISAGIPLKTSVDLNVGQALSADFTGQGWHDRLELNDTPILTYKEAGYQMARLSDQYDFSFFEYWLSDYAGHEQDMSKAEAILDSIDQVLNGLLDRWNDNEGLIIITSDHGNMEDLSTRRHTKNYVPALIIGALQLRRPFLRNMTAITDIYTAILSSYKINSSGLC